MNSFLIILVSLTISTSAYQCQNGKNVINPPSDLSQPTYYPSGYSDDQDPPTVDPGQNCLITVNVPKGYYANVTFVRNFPSATGSYALYSNNKVVRIVNNDPYPFFFFPPQFKINLQTVNNTEFVNIFAFKINWVLQPNAGRTVIFVEEKNPPIAVFPSANLVTLSGRPNMPLSLMAFSLSDPKYSYFLRQTVIFAGDSFDSPFLGTLDQVLSSKIPLTSSQNKISVYSFDLGNYFYCPLFMGQETSDTKDYNSYLGRNCDGGDCTVTLDGSLGKSLTVTQHDGPEIIKGFVNFPETATINVYESTVSDVTLVASFNTTNYQNQLPFTVNKVEKFYELVGSGVVDMIVTRDTFSQSRLHFKH